MLHNGEDALLAAQAIQLEQQAMMQHIDVHMRTCRHCQPATPRLCKYAVRMRQRLGVFDKLAHKYGLPTTGSTTDYVTEREIA